LTDCTRRRLFAFIQQGQNKSITNAIAQVHACYSRSLFPATNLSLLQFLFQFFFIIFFLLGLSFFNLFFFIFVFELFLKNYFVHLHICACLFFSWTFLQFFCDIDFYFLCAFRRRLFWHALWSSLTTRFMQHVLPSSYVDFIMIFFFVI
jgi:hypothetical protein